MPARAGLLYPTIHSRDTSVRRNNDYLAWPRIFLFSSKVDNLTIFGVAQDTFPTCVTLEFFV